ncbi:hypothetical protein EJB05_01750, partial [Eragrostis curvula]
MASSSSVSTPPPPPTARDWASLPRDVLWSVFLSLGQREVLHGAGLACAAWWRFARHEPALWRRIDLTTPGDYCDEDDDDDEELSDDCLSFNLFDHADGEELSDDCLSFKNLFDNDHEDEELSDDCLSFNNLFEDDDNTIVPQVRDNRLKEQDEERSKDDNLFDDDDDEQLGDDCLSFINLFEDYDNIIVPQVRDNRPKEQDEERSNDDNLFDDEEPSDDCLPFDNGDNRQKEQDEERPKDRGDAKGWWKAITLAAVDRSAGQCEAFRGRADDEVLLYLADRASSLKSLSVTSQYDLSSEAFSGLITKFPLLEEIELVLKSDNDNYSTKGLQPDANSWAELLQSASKSCRYLQCLTVRHVGKEWHADSYYQRDPKSEISFSIPTMYGLRSLELFGDSFTKAVVLHIVDKCPCLESLDISNVPHLYSHIEELRKKCSRIKDLTLPAYDSDSDDGGCCCGEFWC